MLIQRYQIPLRMKKYSPDYLRSKRFSNRRICPDLKILYRLKSLGIYKAFNPNRGKRGGVRKEAEKTRSILIIKNQHRRESNSIRVRQKCLVRVERIDNHYAYPKICFTNLRSISNKFDEVQAILHNINPDIAVFTESWITSHNVDAYNVDGFTAVHRIRDRLDKHHGGGVSVYVKSCLTIHESSVSVDPLVEAITLIFRPSLLPRSIPWFSLVAFYYPPSDPHSQLVINFVLSEYDRLLTKNINSKIFLIGDSNDLNLNFLKRIPSLKQLISPPTRGNRILDVCFSNIDYSVSITALPPVGSSDHNVVLMTPDQHRQVVNKKYLTKVRKKKNSCYVLMNEVLSNHNWSMFYKIGDINQATEMFHTFIYELYVTCFPESQKIINRGQPGWMTPKIVDMLELRNNEFRNGNSNGVMSLSQQIKQLITREKKKWFLKKMDQIDSSANFFSLVKLATNKNDRRGFESFPHTSIERSYDQICEFFSGLANSLKPLDDNLDVDNSVGFQIPIADQVFVYKQLRKINPFSSPGPDMIPPFIWKEFAHVLVDPVTSLINLSLSSGVCPLLWKKSFMIVLPKSAVPRGPQQLRPITLSSHLVKICERHLFLSLLPSVVIGMDPMQFGGLPNRSTAQYLVFYIDRVLRSLDNRGMAVCSVITDYVKAFDNLNHNDIIRCIGAMNPVGGSVRWISSFLQDRIQIVKSSKIDSLVSFGVSNGVPQGSVLGGLLFAIVINDLAMDFDWRLKFVDDMSISRVVESPVDLIEFQIGLDKLVDDSKRVSLKINPEKCFVLLHDFRKVPIDPKLYMMGNVLPVMRSIKILGVVIRSDLKWDDQVDNMIKNANKSLFVIYKLKRLGAESKILTRVYITFIRCLLEYCSPVWSDSLTEVQVRSIESVQKRVLKIIMGVKYISYANSLAVLGIPSLVDRRKNLSLNFAKSFFNQFPGQLPLTRGEYSGRNSRNSNLLCLPKCKTRRFLNSPLIALIRSININFKNTL